MVAVRFCCRKDREGKIGQPGQLKEYHSTAVNHYFTSLPAVAVDIIKWQANSPYHTDNGDLFFSTVLLFPYGEPVVYRRSSALLDPEQIRAGFAISDHIDFRVASFNLYQYSATGSDFSFDRKAIELTYLGSPNFVRVHTFIFGRCMFFIVF